jgi:hypothetical protein
MSNFSATVTLENEIVKAVDFTYSHEQTIKNISVLLNGILSNGIHDLVIGGFVTPYSSGGMNVSIAPIFAHSGSGNDVVDTEIQQPVSFEAADATLDRIDIIQLRGIEEAYDYQERKFRDPATGIKTTQEIATKKRIKLEIAVKKGLNGSVAAPVTDVGFVKLAEVAIPAGLMSIADVNIKNVTARYVGDSNAGWTNEPSRTFNPGYFTDIIRKFFVEHTDVGVHKPNIIKSTMIKFGNETGDVNATKIPTGSSMQILEENFNALSGVAQVMTVMTDAINGMSSEYDNHKASTDPHEATPVPASNRIAMYDANKRLKSGAAPVESNDVVRKKELDDKADFLSEAIQDNTTAINAVKGRGGYLIAHDFGTHTPSQEDLDNYALTQIHSDDPADIWNGTHVKNRYVDPDTIDQDHPDGVPDNHVWVLTNTPDTDPPIHEWSDDGFDSVSEFSNDFSGVLQGMKNPGDGSKDGYITAVGKFAKIIGEFAYKDFVYQIGDYYTQYPDTSTPRERGLPGTWEVWSDRAVLYGLSQAAPPSFVDYYSLVGTTIAANATPVVCYHQAGSDWRLYRFIAQTAAYTVPAELDPVKWTYLQPGIIDERRKCANALTDDDYAIGDRVASGSYQTMYVTEIIVPGGKFWGTEGGYRPTFISGGVQEGRIQNIEGSAAFTTISVAFNGNTIGGAFYLPTPHRTGGSGQSSPNDNCDNAIGFDASLAVKTGPDVAPSNLSTRLWRRVS